MNNKNKETVLQHNEKYLKQIKNFRLIDDSFMTVVFANDIPCTELLLSIILEKSSTCAGGKVNIYIMDIFLIF